MSRHLPTDIEAVLLSSPVLSRVLESWEEIGLPDSWLVAGAVAQTWWNDRHGYAADRGIKDIDVIYFDAADLTAASEERQSHRVQGILAGLTQSIDVKNEARVHLWYEKKFGYPVNPYTSSADAIATFPTIAGSIGVRPAGGTLDVCAPFGFADLRDMLVRPNKRLASAEVYREKARRWHANWPRLSVAEWD